IGVHLFDDQLMSAFGHHDGHFGIDGLIAELKGIDRHTIRPHSLDLLSGAIIERLAWADRCAHGLLSGTGPVIAHIAFHHQFGFFFFFGHAKRTSQYAVGTTDTAGSIRRMDHTKIILMDSICRADVGASGILAVHTDLDGGLRAHRSVDIMHVDHAFLSVCFTFRTGHFTGMTADTSLHVYKKSHPLVVIGFGHTGCIYV